MPGTRGALAEEVSPAHLSAPRARGTRLRGTNADVCGRIRTRKGIWGGGERRLGERMARAFLALPLPARHDLARLTKNGSRNRVSCRRYPNTSSNIVAIVELRHRLRLIRTIGSSLWEKWDGVAQREEISFSLADDCTVLYNPAVFAFRVFAEFIK